MKAARTWRRAAFAAIALILLTGCWNRRELNELAIAAALGIDKSNNGVRISTQIINPEEIAAKKGGGKQAPIVIYEADGHTVMEAMHRLTTKMPRELYLAHLRMVVIGEELAREGIGKALDALSRYYEVRTDFYIVVAKGRKASDILETLTMLEKIPANQLNSSLDLSEKTWASTSKTKLDELISAIGNEGKGAVMTGIEIAGDPAMGQNVKNTQRTMPSTILRYSGVGVMRKDKLTGWLTEKESQGYHYTRGKLANADLAFLCPQGDGYVDVGLVRMKSKVRGKMAGGRPVGIVTVHAEGNLTEVSCSMDIMTTKAISRLEREAESEIEESVREAVRKTQYDLHSDVIGFGEAIHRTAPGVWKRLKRDWPQTFRGMEVKVNVDLKIRRIGTVNNPVTKKTEE